MKRSTLNTAIDALEHAEGVKQCYGLISDGEGGHCANGVIAIALGFPITRTKSCGILDMERLRNAYGVPTEYIQIFNDFDNWPFRRIAAWLREFGDKFVTEEDVPEHVPAEWSIEHEKV